MGWFYIAKRAMTPSGALSLVIEEETAGLTSKGSADAQVVGPTNKTDRRLAYVVASHGSVSAPSRSDPLCALTATKCFLALTTTLTVTPCVHCGDPSFKSKFPNTHPETETQDR